MKRPQKRQREYSVLEGLEDSNIDRMYKTLKEKFHHDEFKEGQKDVIDALLSRKKVMVVFPTGAGKSLCYQLPSQILKGLTIVVCPLISLMSNQIGHLRKLGIRAESYDSKLPEPERKRVKEMMR